MDPLCWLGFKKPLDAEDLLLLPENYRANAVVGVLEPFWADVKVYLAGTASVPAAAPAGLDQKPAAGPKSKRPSLFRVLFKEFGFLWVFSCFLYAISVAAQLAIPTFQAQIINVISGSTDGVFMPSVSSSVLARTGLIGDVSEKSMRLYGEARQFNQGRIMNLINVDIDDDVMQFHQVWIIPIQDGPVGSGKSSLLSAIIGEMAPIHTSSSTAAKPLNIYGTIAYAPQQPRILTDTVEGNILFSSGVRADDEEAKAKLHRAMDVTMLEHDMALLPAGSKTLS
ncbi:hypothetical protein DFJ73DRAFT_772322 [Zopfochytrium polystomum]|nr:hypothetical protein DFJ73DRAFT_772322 [Zopfochytrium polystomum]